LDLRKKQALENGVEAGELPFTEIFLRKDEQGIYKSVGVVVGDKVLAVDVDPWALSRMSATKGPTSRPAICGRRCGTSIAFRERKARCFFPKS